MAIRLQLRRGTTAQNNTFAGAEGELTYDTQKKQIRVHNGSTTGGAATIDPVVAWRAPSADNNYVWYRKYASGWVEQGGVILDYYTGGWQAAKNINLPITMRDNKYCVQWTGSWTDYTGEATSVTKKATTYFTISRFTSRQDDMTASWEVKGMAA